MKLFTVPGLGHCSGRPGHADVDWMRPITACVEQAKAPASVIGTRPGTTSTRPHCACPALAVYNGTGDVNAAAIYACRVI